MLSVDWMFASMVAAQSVPATIFRSVQLDFFGPLQYGQMVFQLPTMGLVLVRVANKNLDLIVLVDHQSPSVECPQPGRCDMALSKLSLASIQLPPS